MKVSYMLFVAVILLHFMSCEGSEIVTSGHKPVQIPSTLLQSTNGDLEALLRSAALVPIGHKVLRIMHQAHQSSSGMTKTFDHKGKNIICADMQHVESNQGRTLCIPEQSLLQAERISCSCCDDSTVAPTPTPTPVPTVPPFNPRNCADLGQVICVEGFE
eukprot:TRINITY_DN62978_c0_g1_i1.p1 TRINITY_DN62978_c0_g1~~TRINITY_DN62978_c0_g1_i1.p1  ORF type:complete len:160 (-),score=12.31 TRINITY_DN62978_c0_g1_i1:137-616(-)